MWKLSRKGELGGEDVELKAPAAEEKGYEDSLRSNRLRVTSRARTKHRTEHVRFIFRAFLKISEIFPEFLRFSASQGFTNAINLANFRKILPKIYKNLHFSENLAKNHKNTVFRIFTLFSRFRDRSHQKERKKG